MTTTVFVDGSTVVPAAWLNDVNSAVYNILGNGTIVPANAAAARTNLGSTTVGDALFITASAAAARTTLGAAASGALGSSGITGAAASGANADINTMTALTSISGLSSINTGPLAGFRNIIYNGGFTINQRAYASGAALAAGIYGHDRWKAGSGGGDYTFTQLKSNTTITIAANKTLIQVIEDVNVQSTSYVLSWTGTALARYAINSNTPAGSYAASPILITGQTAGSTLSVEFGNGASSGTLGKVQLEVGAATNQATVFENRPYSLELEMCMRYGESMPYLWTQYTLAGDGFGSIIPFKVTKRAAATITNTNTTTTNITGASITGSTFGVTPAGSATASASIVYIGTLFGAAEL
jgi:hypothetical protein